MRMVLDFSTASQDFWQREYSEDWQKKIIDFIKEYLSNDCISAQTSGSTGVAKKIKLSKKAMQQSAKLTGNFFQLKKGNTALLCLPVNYIAGKMMIVRAIELGLKLYCIEPKSVVEIQNEVDFAALTPMQAERSLSFLPLMKTVILGGAPVSQDLENILKNISSEFYETYGMTETITHIALRKLNKEIDFKALNSIELSQDERGCLVIQTPYFKEAVITNDVVELKGRNRFKWLGRADNVINSGGIKINPEEIENILKPYISSHFIVAGMKDKLLGQKLILIIEGVEQKIEIPQGLLPKNKMPKEIYFLPKFIRTESGKIKRGEILRLLEK